MTDSEFTREMGEVKTRILSLESEVKEIKDDLKNVFRIVVKLDKNQSFVKGGCAAVLFVFTSVLVNLVPWSDLLGGSQ